MSVPVKRLAYGLKFGTLIPEEAPAYWGARAIYHTGTVDFVPNRMDMMGLDEDRRQLVAALDEIRALKTIQQFYRTTFVSPSEAAQRMVYEDDRVAIAASPNGSGGYLYITAWLKENPPSCDCVDAPPQWRQLDCEVHGTDCRLMVCSNCGQSYEKEEA